MAQNFQNPFGTSGASNMPSTQAHGVVAVPGAPSGVSNPSAMLPVDLAALQGISPEQLAAIARLFQSGALPMAPPLTAPPNQMSPSSDLQVTPSQANVHGQNTAPLTNDTSDEEPGSDMEDGELDDAPPARDFLRPPPTGPRNGSSMSTNSSATPRSQQPSVPNNTQASRAMAYQPIDSFPRVSTQLPRPTTSNNQDNFVKAFILELHSAGYSFGQIAQELGNTRLLRHIFHALGLQANELNYEASAQHEHHAQELGEKATNGNITVARTIPPKAAAPLDRKAYLARLQAAKNKKAETVPTPPPGLRSSSLDASQTKSVTLSNQSVLSATSGSETERAAIAQGTLSRETPSRLSAKNDLIRQRLEALKASQAAKSNGSIGQVVQAPTEFASARSQPVAQNELVGTTSTGHEQNRSQGAGLAGLPGLFMIGAQTYNGVPTIEPHPSYGLSPARHAAVGTGRPFGHNRHSYTNDSVIITVSDDEEDDSDADGEDEEDEDDQEQDMDLDDDDEEDHNPKTLKTASVKHSASQQPGQAVSTFASKAGNIISSTDSSTPSTPSHGVLTPNADLKRKLQEIEEAKRRLVEAQQKRLKPNKTAHGLSTTLLEGTLEAVAAANASTESNGPIPLPAALPGLTALDQNVLTSNASRDPAADRLLMQQRLKENLQQRIQALRSGAPSPASKLTSTALITHATDASLPKGPVPVDALASDFNQAADTTVPPSMVATEAMNIAHPDPNQQQALTPTALADQNKPFLDHANDIRVDTDGSVLDDEDLDDIYDPAESTVLPANVTNHTEINSSVPEIEMAISSTDDSDATLSSSSSDDAGDGSSSEDDSDNDDKNENGEGDDDSDSSSDESEMSIVSHDDRDAQQASQPPFSLTKAAQIPLTEADHVPLTADAPPHENGHVLELLPARESMEVENTVSETPKIVFRPYESPLRAFKDYRYHPEFLNDVSGGHKSFTYSHKIDPSTPMCHYELDGGICNDRSCTLQHFRDITLSDNDLLRIMGAEHIPAKTPEGAQQWKTGLGELIRQLRSSDLGNSAEVIAARIAEYHRAFRGDETKVLRKLD